jgi:hypothetical protein
MRIDDQRPEHQLLLACARTAVTPEQTQRIRKLATQPVQWDYLFALARRHAVVPLVAHSLQRHASDIVPSEHLQLFKREYRENAARNIVLTNELSRLLNLLAGVGVEAVPYKGPVLAQLAYGDLSLRRFVDLDVMVRRKDVLRARDVLLAEGFLGAKSLTPDQQELLFRTQHNWQFIRDERKFIVELHWDVASHLFASSVTAEELWERLVPIEVSGTTMKTFVVEELLLSLCVHGSRHLWERLAWVCDIAELVNRKTIDWEFLRSRTSDTDTERMFLLGLQLAQDLLDVRLPESIRELMREDEILPELAREITERYFTGTTHIPASSREVFRYNLTVRRSWKSRLRYVVYTFRPTDRDVSSFSVPRGLGFSYYLLRPFRVLNKHTS